MVARPAAPWQRSAALFLLVALAFYPIPGCTSLPNPQTFRAIHVIPLVALIAAVGVVAVADLVGRLGRYVPSSVRRGLVPLVFALVAAVYVVEVTVDFRCYFGDYPDEVLEEFQYGVDGVVEYALAHEADYDEIWVTDTNQPYIYVLFFGEWSPNDVHEGLVIRRNPPGFNAGVALGRFRFVQGIRSDPPSDIHAGDLDLVFSTTYPNGQTAYEVRAGEIPGRGRVLLIARP